MLKRSGITFLFAVILLVFSTHSLFSQTDANTSVQGICIYIDYPDVLPTVTPTQLEGILNDLSHSEPGINRSFRTYWQQETRRNFDLQHDIFYYTAPQPSTFYETIPWFDGIDLWRDALEWIIANNPTYDWNSLSKWNAADPFNAERPGFLDGAIKSSFVISSAYGPAGLGAAHTPVWTLSNGETIGTIQGSTLQRPWDAGLNLFTLCHETGHSLFRLPDTYDYGAESGGTAKYSVMSAQGPDIEPVGAPFLVMHNWGHVKEPGVGTHTYTLQADGDTVIAIRNIHDPNEFFSLEVRKNSTLGNSLFPAPLGLLIWHSDLKVNTSNTLEDATRYAHYKHSVIQKDGLFELENGGPVPPINIGDIYLPGDEFNDASSPDANWWAGENSGIEIKDIQFIGTDKLQFTVVISEVHETHYPFISKADWTLISETPAQAGFGGSNAFDDDNSTYYHVPFSSTEPRPHELVIDLGIEYEINEFYYTANDNYYPPWEGRIKDFELYFSTDGINWDAPIVAESFFQTPYKQYALFSSVDARYVKFSALNSYNDDSRTSIAEIDIRGRDATLTSLEEHSLLHKLNLSPNPTRDFVQIEGLKKEWTLQLFDAFGVLHQEIKNPNSTLSLDLRNYPAGMYVLSVLDKNNFPITSKKLIKNN
ncbi:MAG: M6 family metalloprotease-like protein [Limisphaerales bacterium]|jgi:M6 family metalloprotease-like protein